MKNYLCTIIEMYDGREFIYDQLLITTDQDVYKIMEVQVQNITHEDEDWSWQGKWWTNHTESAYTIGSIREVLEVHKQVLVNYFETIAT